MANRRRKITREDWDRFLDKGIRPRGVSRATLYRRARSEGWQTKPPPPPRKSQKVEQELTRREQTVIVEKLKIRLEHFATNRAQTDQQVLRLISKLRCLAESLIDEVVAQGRLLSSGTLVRLTRMLMNLEKLERHRQEWIAKVTEKEKRIVLIERVTRERPPDPEEMAQLPIGAPTPHIPTGIPGPTSAPQPAAKP